ncbi:MAG TPA: hypothetical protein VH598_06235, partial [Verrucomicrobiae bacterium]|nr:hypothetical protein [Verrucomicrobiae bacterium]
NPSKSLSWVRITSGFGKEFIVASNLAEHGFPGQRMFFKPGLFWLRLPTCELWRIIRFIE